jgi:hypothetical protein
VIYSCVVLGLACMVSKKENGEAWLPIAAKKRTSDRQANFCPSSQLMTVCMHEFMRRHRMGIRGGYAKDVGERGRGGESWGEGAGGNDYRPLRRQHVGSDNVHRPLRGVHVRSENAGRPLCEKHICGENAGQPFMPNSFEVSMRIGRSGLPRVFFFYDRAVDPSYVPTTGRPARHRNLRPGLGSSYVFTTGGYL